MYDIFGGNLIAIGGALAAWRARRGAKHRAEGEARKGAAPLGATPKFACFAFSNIKIPQICHALS